MIRIVDVYIGRTLLATTFLSLAVLVGLSSLINFVEQLRKVGVGDYDMTAAGVYVLLSMPREVEQFFPMATLLGGLIGMGILASNSELTVMQAAGLSKWNLINAAMKSALILVVFIMALGEWVAPPLEAKAKEIRTQAISGGRLFSADQLVWAKDGANFVSIKEVVNRALLHDVHLYEFDPQQNLTKITFAKQAHFEGDRWRLMEVDHTWLSPQAIRNEKRQQDWWESSLTPDKLGVVAVKPEALSIRGLMDYIQYLVNNSQDANRYELALWRKLLQPVSVGVMLLMALSFVFGPLRSVTMGARIIMGVLTGFGFFIANEVFGPIAMVYQFSPVVGALLPSLLFAAVAAYLLRR